MTINVLHQQKALSNQQTLGINQIFTIDAPAVVAGNTVYRKVFFLRLPADANAAQLVLKNIALAATFSAFTFNVGSESDFLKPQGWRQQDGKTVIRLQRAWPIDRINSNSHNAFSLYRVDGESIVDEATVSGTTSHGLGSSFVSHEFAVALSNISSLELSLAIGGKNFSTRAKASKSSSPLALAGDSVGGFIGGIDNAALVNIFGLRSVGIFGMPSTPRIGILQDAVIDTAVEAGNYAEGGIDWLSLIPGEHPAGISANVAADVLPRIQSVIDARRAAGANANNTVIVPVIFESDSPCRCTLNQFQASYVLRNILFGDAQDAKQLRFSGASVDGQHIPLTLPRGVIESVSLAINDAAQDSLAVGVSAQAAQRQSASGAAITTQQAVAARVSLPIATVVRGVSIAVNALTMASSIEIALIEDRNGTPSGGVLASAVRQIDRVGTRQSINIPFDPPNAELLLDQKPYWLLLRTTAGSLLWLATPALPPQKILLIKDLQSSTSLSGVTQAARPITGIALDFGWILNRNASDAIDVSFSIERQPIALQADSASARRHFLQLPPSLAQSTAETPLTLTVTRASAGVVSLRALQIDYQPLS